MDLTDSFTAALADRYVIEREIGRGGMATVFLARDLKHDRRVAVKVLDPELGAVLGASRFLAEIKVTANLQHPNLLPLFDSGEAAGLLYYVMPYVDGESLRARLDREKQLPVDEAVRITTAIATALEYAHAHAVVHRDLKPENILMQAGQPIIADFGIALAVSNAGGSRVTQTGLSLGTPTYMSPEQATGDRTIDGRSDIYALGAMAYEMLVGEPPHTGATSQAIIARLITEKPRPVSASRPSVPAHVDAAIMRALEKLPADRWSTAGEFANAMRGGVVTGDMSRWDSSARATVARPRRTVVAWIAAAVMMAAFVALLALHLGERPAEPPTLRFTIPLPEGRGLMTAYDFAVSPDGSAVAFAAVDTAGDAALWIRRLDSLTAYKLAGTEAAASPFWSPDGRSVGFFANGTLKRVDLDGTAPRTVVQTTGDRGGGVWLAGDQIVFERGDGVLAKVSARGGTVTATTVLDTSRAELNHARPQVLGDGRHFLYTAASYRGKLRGLATWIGSVDGGPGRFVGRGSIYSAPPRHLLMIRGPQMVAVEIDPRTFEQVGDTTGVLGLRGGGPSGGPVSASSGGVLVQGVPRGAPSQTSLELLDRSGSITKTVGARLTRVGHIYYAIRLSHDGRRVVFEQHVGAAGGDLYAADVQTGVITRETFDADNHQGNPAWSPDGRHIVFSSTRTGGGDLYVKTAGQPDDKALGASSPFPSTPSDWSRDGSTVFFDRIGFGTQYDIWTMKSDGSGAKPLIASPASEMQATLSPDGRWIAYASDEETGRYEIFVKPFPTGEQRWKISTTGGEAPHWRADGKELFFLAPALRGESQMMAVPIDGSGGFKWDTPQTLFTKPIRKTAGFLRSGVYYDVAPDGRTFVAVINSPSPLDRPGELTVTMNWRAALKKPR